MLNLKEQLVRELEAEESLKDDENFLNKGLQVVKRALFDKGMKYLPCYRKDLGDVETFEQLDNLLPHLVPLRGLAGHYDFFRFLEVFPDGRLMNMWTRMHDMYPSDNLAVMVKFKGAGTWVLSTQAPPRLPVKGVSTVLYTHDKEMYATWMELWLQAKKR